MEIDGREYEIEVRVNLHFRGEHSLPSRPELHPHLWEVEFSVSGPLNPATGMVCDMLTLAEFFKPFVHELDGCNLHAFKGFQQQQGIVGLASKFPTCDTLAHYFLWKTSPPFKASHEFKGLRISQIKVSIFEPDGKEPWGHALIRPKLT